MIGDWVNILNYHYDGSPCVGQVDGITKKHGTYYLQFGSALSAEIDRCEPISITPEILEKNGWELRPTGYVFHIDGGKSYDNTLWYIFNDNTFVVENAEFSIKYIHELQHALRLCGINKTIEL